MGQPASPRAPSRSLVHKRTLDQLSHTLSNIRSLVADARPAERVCALARSPDRGGGITYEAVGGGREGGCFECSFRVKETVNRSIAGGRRDGEREKERKEGRVWKREGEREGEREVMEEKECVNQPVSGGEKSWGEERQGGRKRERNRA